MASPRTVTFELDSGVVRLIESQVAAGLAPSLDDFVRDAVEIAAVNTLFEEIDEDSPEFEAWIAEGLAEEARYDDEPGAWLSVEELRAQLVRPRTEGGQPVVRAAE